MAKAINWPPTFRDEVLAEDTTTLRCAFRLGRLYYDNHYWVDGDVVLVRVNHRIIRQATVVGDLKCCRIADLSADDYAAQKQPLQTQANVVAMLAATYAQPVTPDTEITVVYYRNHPVDPELLEVIDDPHMA